MSEVWALLPLKDLVQAKSRLSGILAPHERRALAQAMVEDVLSALVSHTETAGVLLVSDDPAAALLAHRYDIEWVDEKGLACSGLNGAIAAATDHLKDRDVTDIMVLHGDIPLLQTADLDALQESYWQPGTDVTLGPDLQHDGTNVMMFATAQTPVFHYGPGSLHTHRQAALERGLSVSLVERPGIGLDVDRPADLLELYHLLPTAGAASHSKELLLNGDIARRLRIIEHSGLGSQGDTEHHDAV
jgi:2-phospho-L-lactate guanylyltransferase